jgi:hypothetical protein
MRIYDITEGRDAPLLHGASIFKAIRVLDKDAFPAHTEHDIPGMGMTKGISLSRNKRMAYNYVVFTFDQSRLIHNHKIVPLDGDQTVAGKTSIYRDRGNRDGFTYSSYNNMGKTADNGTELSEEFLVGPLRNMSKYCIEVTFRIPTHYIDQDEHPKNYTEVAQKLQAGCERLGIPFKIDPKIQQKIQQEKEQEQE